ncbi:glycerol-3-phosphate responsive antiterminator [Virgibacillus sp. MG-45]|uniref:glycerol-3-phosphate responsive antiterminator n=1 Tax=Virgibacillus sp. MG-45 TaxID=3102791 RepID=UPI002ED9A769
MRSKIVDIVQSQVIASVKEESDLPIALQANSNIIFLLTGNLMTVNDYVEEIKKANKACFIHVDFIEGLSNSKSAIQYIADVWQPAGIITTKSNMVKMAKEARLLTIQRLFLIDRNAMKKGIEIAHTCKPDAIEVLPGIMPHIIDELTALTHLPIIAGGLVSNKNEIMQGLEAGALAISSGNPKLWNLDL